MPGHVESDVIDVMLQSVIDNGDTLNICNAEPTTFTEATATYMLAQGAITSADYTLADGDVSGRKVTLAAQSGLVVADAGTTAYAAITDSVASALLIVIPCSALLLYVGNTVNTTASDWEVQDVS